MMLLVVGLLAVLTAAYDRARHGILARCTGDAISSRWMPVALGIISSLSVSAIWGSWQAPVGIHDERAYVLQARLFATFRWTAPTPPVPIAWEMPHVFLEPAIFSKYPPGHSLMLTPGIWIGAPALIPILLTGLAGALLFLLARRHADAVVASLAWLLWTTSPAMLQWHSTYMSQTSTVVLWLLTMLAMSTWWQRPSARSAMGVISGLALMGITRPMSGLMLALPVGGMMLFRSVREREWRGISQGMMAGILISAIVPLWMWRSTGALHEIPYSSYSRYYFPFDLPGFHVDTTPAIRALPPDMQVLGRWTRLLYQGHVPEAIWGNFIARSMAALQAALSSVTLPLLVCLPVGLIALGLRRGGFVLTVFVTHVAGYLLMPHGPSWTIYYLELFPLTALMIAIGLVSVMRHLKSWHWLPHWMRDTSLSLTHVLLASAVVLLPLMGLHLDDLRRAHVMPRARQQQLEQIIEALPSPHAVIFVQRDSLRIPHFTLVGIRGVPTATPTWVVRGMGDSLNAALLREADDRRPYQLNERTMTLSPYP
jgi:hypothetical protein